MTYKELHDKYIKLCRILVEIYGIADEGLEQIKDSDEELKENG